MKLLIVIATLLSSLSSFANFYPNQSWNYSATSCNAYTQCPNGRVISCQVYGMNYGNVPSYMSNQCRAFAIPGRFVQCQGYVQRVDTWGNRMWASVNLPISCY
jgi:hypothetical protein